MRFQKQFLCLKKRRKTAKKNKPGCIGVGGGVLADFAAVSATTSPCALASAGADDVDGVAWFWATIWVLNKRESSA